MGYYNTDNTYTISNMMSDSMNDIKNKYDYILMDCMPSLGMITINVLASSDKVIIPVQTQYLAARNMEQLLRTFSKVKRQINPELNVEEILLTLHDNRTNFAKEVDNGKYD